MKSSFLINSQSTSPLREAGFFVALTLVLTWLFWLPGVNMSAPLGDMLLGIGSFAPLAVAIFLDIWLQNNSLKPLAWLKTISLPAVVVGILIPIFMLVPVMLLRFDQGTLQIKELFTDALSGWSSLLVLLLLSLAEEIGWRAYLLPRLKSLPVYLINLLVGVLWFVWQLPIIFVGRYNEAENFGEYLVSMFLFALLITPFLNRLARRAGYNPILSAILRAMLQFVIALYFLQGRADPLTDTFGIITLAWLVILNIVLFSQLWQGKKPPAEITELERVMPLEIGS